MALNAAIGAIMAGECDRHELKRMLKTNKQIVTYQRVSDGVTALMAAAYSGSRHNVSLLLNNGADPAARDKRGRCFIHYVGKAAHRSQSVRCKLLLASLDAVDADQVLATCDDTGTRAMDVLEALVREDPVAINTIRLSQVLRRFQTRQCLEPEASRKKKRSYWETLPPRQLNGAFTWNHKLAEAFMQDYDDMGLDPFGNGWEFEEKDENAISVAQDKGLTEDEYYNFLYDELTRRSGTYVPSGSNFFGATEEEIKMEANRRENLHRSASSVTKDPSLKLRDIDKIEYTVKCSIFFEKLEAAINTQAEEIESLMLKDIPFPSNDKVQLQKQLLQGSEECDLADKRKIIRLAQRRWHPDKWIRFKSLFKSNEIDNIFGKVAETSQQINQLLQDFDA